MTIAVTIVSVAAYVAGVPVFLIAPACVMLLVSFVMRSFFAEGRDWRRLFTPRRVLAMFGVIPVVAATIGFLMFRFGFTGIIALWAFGGVVLGCDFVYLMWFDRDDSNGARQVFRRSNSQGNDPSERVSPDQ